VILEKQCTVNTDGLSLMLSPSTYYIADIDAIKNKVSVLASILEPKEPPISVMEQWEKIHNCNIFPLLAYIDVYQNTKDTYVELRRNILTFIQNLIAAAINNPKSSACMALETLLSLQWQFDARIEPEFSSQSPPIRSVTIPFFWGLLFVEPQFFEQLKPGFMSTKNILALQDFLKFEKDWSIVYLCIAKDNANKNIKESYALMKEILGEEAALAILQEPTSNKRNLMHLLVQREQTEKDRQSILFLRETLGDEKFINLLSEHPAPLQQAIINGLTNTQLVLWDAIRTGYKDTLLELTAHVKIIASNKIDWACNIIAQLHSTYAADEKNKPLLKTISIHVLDLACSSGKIDAAEALWSLLCQLFAKNIDELTIILENIAKKSPALFVGIVKKLCLEKDEEYTALTRWEQSYFPAIQTSMDYGLLKVALQIWRLFHETYRDNVEELKKFLECVLTYRQEWFFYMADELSDDLFVQLVTKHGLSGSRGDSFPKSMSILYELAREFKKSDVKQSVVDSHIELAFSLVSDRFKGYSEQHINPHQLIQPYHKRCLYELLTNAKFRNHPANLQKLLDPIKQNLSMPRQNASAEETAFDNLKTAIAKIVLDAYYPSNSAENQDTPEQAHAIKSKGMCELLNFVLFYLDTTLADKDEYVAQLTFILQDREKRLIEKGGSETYYQQSIKEPGAQKLVNVHYTAVIAAAKHAATHIVAAEPTAAETAYKEHESMPQLAQLIQYCREHKQQMEHEKNNPQALTLLASISSGTSRMGSSFTRIWSSGKKEGNPMEIDLNKEPLRFSQSISRRPMLNLSTSGRMAFTAGKS